METRQTVRDPLMDCGRGTPNTRDRYQVSEELKFSIVGRVESPMELPTTKPESPAVGADHCLAHDVSLATDLCRASRL
jgi:hypothetical protein